MKYKFLGQPDEFFPDLKHGNIYDLNIYNIYPPEEYQIGIQIIGTKHTCYYETAIHFYENWKLVR